MENTLTIIMPAYNEEESLKSFIPEVIDNCKKNSYKLIIVNDGSKDNTKEILKGFSDKEDFIKIINHKVNKGYGGAIKSGILNATTDYVVTIDADGQHNPSDIPNLFSKLKESDADMIVGSRIEEKINNYYRHVGKSIIRKFAKLVMTVPIRDINSGMKLYNTELAKKYIPLSPDTMAFSDIIALMFLNQKHLVLEEPVQIRAREKGKSTISTNTAFNTILAILSVLVLFNPMRVFLPIAFINIVFGILWGLPFLIMGRGVSNGAIITIISGILFFFLGLIADQLSMLRKERLK
ncbi:MAG: glycosyltransferase family 2 protein [Bacteroidales bacterium]|jgi:glycosyltransferase involved in cell wall biosynthesis